MKNQIEISISSNGVMVGDRIYNKLGKTHEGYLRHYDYNSYSNSAVIEQTEHGIHNFICCVNNKTSFYNAYTHESLMTSTQNHKLYMGFTPEEVLDSGRDILAEKILCHGELNYKTVAETLPVLNQDTYCFLGGEASQSSVCVNHLGQIFSQYGGAVQTLDPFFVPEMVDDNLSKQKPYQCFLDGYLPILFTIYNDNKEIHEFMYFVEHGDPDSDPIVWIRFVKYNKTDKNKTETRFMIASASPAREPTRAIQEAVFWDAFITTVAYWSDYNDKTTQFSIPESTLSAVTNGAMISLATTFTGDHAHYGHKHYGHEANDNFLPSYI